MSDDRTRLAAPQPDPTAAADSGPPADPATTLQSGGGATIRAGEFPDVPGYAVTGEIGRGGMGRVLAATDLRFGREVAVKLPLPGHATGEAGRLFVREAVVTGRLAHPGVPPAHHLGELADGTPFLVMKLVRGRTLADLLAARPDPAHDLPRFVAAVEQVCQAVGYAHARGVVHRDLKPANVMVGAFGEVQVMDWGLAAAGAGAVLAVGGGAAVADAPAAGSGVTGTPAYMAPEQARGEDVAARADVFALGGILCAVLVGRPPFRGADVGTTLARAAAGDTADVLAALAACPADPELVGVARRCLTADRADRPADGAAVAGLIAAYRAGVEARLRAAEQDRAAAEVRRVERRKRRRVQLALAAAVVLLLAGGGAAAWWKDAHDRDARELGLRADRLEAERQADAFRRAAEAERADADRRVALARRDQEVGALLAEAEAAVRASDAPRAALVLGQIGGPDAARMAPAAAARLARCRAGLLLLPELDRIEDVRWQVSGGKFRQAEAAAAAAAVLARLGIEPGKTPPAEAAAAVAGSLVVTRLVAELTWWVVTARDEPALQQALTAALDRLDPDPFRAAARAAVVGRRWDEVAALLARADGANQPAWFVAAVASVNRVDAGARARAAEAAVLRHPDDFAALMILGQLDHASRSGTAASRARACQAAVALRPGSAAAWYNLGTARRDGGEAAAALAAFDESVRLAPGYAAAHTGRGTALAALGRREEEAAAYRAAIAADPGYAPAHNNLGAVRFARATGAGPGGGPPGALARAFSLAAAGAAYARALDLNPTYSAALCGLGDVWRAAGRLDLAADLYQRAVTAVPADPAGYQGLGFTRESERDVPGAVAVFRRGVRECPRSASLHYFLARALAMEGRLAEGRDLLRAAVRLDPRYAAAHLELARQLEAGGELEGALEHYEAAVAAAPADEAAAAGRDRIRGRLPAPRK